MAKSPSWIKKGINGACGSVWLWYIIVSWKSCSLDFTQKKILGKIGKMKAEKVEEKQWGVRQCKRGPRVSIVSGWSALSCTSGSSRLSSSLSSSLALSSSSLWRYFWCDNETPLIQFCSINSYCLHRAARWFVWYLGIWVSHHKNSKEALQGNMSLLTQSPF